MKTINSVRGTIYLGLVLLAGCATHYDLTLNNGEIITAKGKPHYDKVNGAWIYTDANGQPAHLPGGSVKEVSPTSMDTGNSMNFIPASQK